MTKTSIIILYKKNTGCVKTIVYYKDGVIIKTICNKYFDYNYINIIKKIENGVENMKMTTFGNKMPNYVFA